MVFNKKSTSCVYKLKQCRKYNIPAVNPKFVDQCLSKKRLLETDLYKVADIQDESNFKQGKIQSKLKVLGATDMPLIAKSSIFTIQIV